MSAYADRFDLDLMSRTLEVVRAYDGPRDATVLANCLLGVLVVARQELLEKLPEKPIASLAEWGVSPKSITRYGRCRCGGVYPTNLQQLVRELRNAVAHFDVKPEHCNGEVTGFRFTGQHGFVATFTLTDLRTFMEQIVAHLA